MSDPKPEEESFARAQTNEAIGALQKQVLRTRQKVYALEAEAKLAREGKKPRRPVQFRSQYGEDLMIWDLLGGPTEGFFIEVGAFDGYQYSVTYALEAAGWNGLLIEAIPEKFARCKARRPDSRVVHAAVGAKGSTGTTTFTVCDDEYGGMLSYLDANTEHARGLSSRQIPMSKVTVDLTTIDDLLTDHKGPIDLAVIDVEGTEVAVLDGFDVARWKPRLMLLEDNTPGGDPKLTQALSKKPYVQVGWIECNRIYVRNDCIDIRDRLLELNLYV
jgi:FkbM family methyltransferase